VGETGQQAAQGAIESEWRNNENILSIPYQKRKKRKSLILKELQHETICKILSGHSLDSIAATVNCHPGRICRVSTGT